MTSASIRVVQVRRAVETTSHGRPTVKLPKNGRVCTTIFPKSLADDLGELIACARAEGGDDALLFPGPRGAIMPRSAFQSVVTPTRRR